MDTIYIVLAGVFILIAFFAFTYNSFIKLNLRVRNAFAGIDNQLKRRYDLIPSLVQIVKGYAQHEKGLFEEVTRARSGLMTRYINRKEQAEKETSEAINKLIAVAESYPELKANENFRYLQTELVGTEDKIAYARQYYNDSVMKFNNRLMRFPTNIVGKMLKYKEKPYLQAEEMERENVEVEL